MDFQGLKALYIVQYVIIKPQIEIWVQIFGLYVSLRQKVNLCYDFLIIRNRDIIFGMNIALVNPLQTLIMRVFAGKTPVYEISILTCINLMLFSPGYLRFCLNF